MIVNSPHANSESHSNDFAVVARTPLAPHLRGDCEVNEVVYAANLLSARPDGYVCTGPESTVIAADPPAATTPCMDEFVPSVNRKVAGGVQSSEAVYGGSNRIYAIQEEQTKDMELHDEDGMAASSDDSDSDEPPEEPQSVSGSPPVYRGSPSVRADVLQTPRMLANLPHSALLGEESRQTWTESRPTASFGRPTPCDEMASPRSHSVRNQPIGYVRAAASSLTAVMGRMAKRRRVPVLPPHPGMDEMSCERRWKELSKHYVCLIGLKASELNLAEAQLAKLGFKVICRVAMSGNRQYVRLAGPPNERLRLIRRKVLAMLDNHGRKTRMVALSLPLRDEDVLNELWHFKEIATRDKIIMMRPEDQWFNRWLSPVRQLLNRWPQYLNILKVFDAMIPFAEFSTRIEEPNLLVSG